MAIDRSAFLAAAARRYVTVHVPEMGEVRLQSLTHAERVDANQRAATSPHDVAVWFVIAAVVDDHGNTLFSEADAAMIAGFDVRVMAAIDRAMAGHVFGAPAEKKS